MHDQLVSLHSAVTSSMLFPWERRQFDGKPGGLKTWEKLYWGIFVTSISVFLFSRVLAPKGKEKVGSTAPSLAVVWPCGGCPLRLANAAQH